MLIVNRTSKGGSGEYCGISAFYDYEISGPAQHNQGIFRVFDLQKDDLIVLTAIMNTTNYRKHCSNLTMGSKMKKLKLYNILNIPFPKFPDKIRNEIINLYSYNNDVIAY